jgi:hypothetical protein
MREELVRELEAMRAGTRTERDQFEQQLCREAQVRQELIAMIEAMRTSTSWRTTRPLRFFGDKLKQLRS